MNDLLFGVSLTASFLGGMVALFAPCCITFLFPSYLGTIFKERGRVVLLTMIFALGLGSVLVPVALGMKLVVTLFNQYHTTTYLLGALFMFLLGLMTLFEVKLMLPLPHYTMPRQTTVFSTYLLGLFSGITSACCAPVLFAAVTLTSLSPTLLSSFIVATVYVLGIVFPLFFLSLFYQKISDRYLYNVKKNVEKPLKLLASATFMLSAGVITYMAISGKIVMEENEQYGKFLREFIFGLSARISNSVLDIVVLFVIVASIIFLVRHARKENAPIKSDSDRR